MPARIDSEVVVAKPYRNTIHTAIHLVEIADVLNTARGGDKSGRALHSVDEPQVPLEYVRLGSNGTWTIKQA